MNWVYDGKKNLYTPEENPVFTKTRKTFPIEVQTARRTRNFNVHVQWAATINFVDLYKYLKHGNIECPQEAIMNLEISLRHGAMKNPNCFISGRSIYFDDQRTNMDLPGGAELWLGYHQSVRACDAGLCLNIDTTCTAFMKRRHIIDILLSAAQVQAFTFSPILNMCI